MALTKKRRIFIDEYLRCWNATEAARRAKYKNPNKLGPRLVKVGEIQAEIKRRLQESAMEADEVLSRLADQARADISDFIVVDKETGRPAVDLRRAEGKTHLIKSIRETRSGIIIELYSAQAALTQMGKAYGIFEEKHVHGLDESTRRLFIQLGALATHCITDPEMRDKFRAELEGMLSDA